jgi:TPR repeat protein
MWLVILVVGVAVLAGVGGFFAFHGSSTAAISTPAAKPLMQPAEVAALKNKAEGGDAQAQADLAKLYVAGEVITNDYSAAANWYRKSAEQGNASGEAGLAELFEAGRGVKKDMTEAFKWYRVAAAHGSPGAQYALGFHYESGSGVPQDQVEATKWYRMVAEQGDALAQYDIGQRYDLGIGIGADPVEALKWFLLASSQGQVDSTKRAAAIKDKMSRDQIAEAKRRADAFVPKNGSKG